MAYIRDKDGETQYPFEPDALRSREPGTSFPASLSDALLAEYGIVPVVDTPPPAVLETEQLREAAPVKGADGQWRRAWAIDTMAAPQVAAKLDRAKLAVFAKLKARRDAAIDAGCAVAGIGKFDSDEAARGNLTGAVTGAILAQGQPFSLTWKLADNSVITVSGAQIMAAGMAVLTRVSACHSHAQQLYSAASAAADFAALAAVNIETGWPA